MQLNVNTWKCAAGNNILTALLSISTYAFHKAWHSIMACVFHNTNKNKFNGSCYECNCFNL